MIGKARVIAAGWITRGKNRFVDAEGDGVIAAMHGSKPLGRKIGHGSAF